MFISYPVIAFENLRIAIDEANKIKDPKQRLDSLRAASEKITVS